MLRWQGARRWRQTAKSRQMSRQSCTSWGSNPSRSPVGIRSIQPPLVRDCASTRRQAARACTRSARIGSLQRPPAHAAHTAHATQRMPNLKENVLGSCACKQLGQARQMSAGDDGGHRRVQELRKEQLLGQRARLLAACVVPLKQCQRAAGPDKHLRWIQREDRRCGGPYTPSRAPSVGHLMRIDRSK